MLLRIHPKDPQERLIKQVAETLRNGGIIVYPTDTIYGLGCDIYQTKAIEQICRIKQIDPRKAQLSFVCCDLSHLSDFARQISNTTYRVLKEHLPGPYTFILPASKQVPKILQSKKDTIGLRVPNNKIVHELVKELGHPILSTTLPGDFVEDYTDPEIIYDKYKNLVDLVVDGGIGGSEPSTIINCVDDAYEVIRMGAGEWEE
ncbi:L-threonylcarbamoyladenylate synthase [Niabella yanshanensis]|uniref:L-threonylcarbamoyladenylate synthase n=1 Tax=Niabella yanshanensis TaxID=577386 RepID=A0ABZ0WDH1_9BACT|nr:L-threonylcarbamoyladenylate synthase [Niabella yanshanensis]WQD40738.1 L-threonylcarbamoyladenylate synthase [Niabella yanshanensis]